MRRATLAKRDDEPRPLLYLRVGRSHFLRPKANELREILAQFSDRPIEHAPTVRDEIRFTNLARSNRDIDVLDQHLCWLQVSEEKMRDGGKTLLLSDVKRVGI